MEFFNFLGEEDGEDLKREFKKRVVEAELLLTEGEKEHIIAEAQVIFTSVVELVGELDNVMGMDQGDGSSEEAPEPHLLRPALSMPIRDSFSVTQDRLSKKVRTPSDTLENEVAEPLLVSALRLGPAKVDAVDHISCSRKRSPDGKTSPNRVSFCPSLSQDPQELHTFSLASATTLLPLLAVILFLVLWYFM
jgi:hypothetical protein